MDVHLLPHVNATLNGLAAALLIVGYLLIKSGRREAHKNTMLASFAVSVLFLICYLIYHALAGSKSFPADAPSSARYFYFFVLITHIVLAGAVPFLAIWTIVLGLRERWERHGRVARWTYPIWLYVSITGVVVYLMLYQLFPSSSSAASRAGSPTAVASSGL
ncbi:MAG: DUF420 domain-containing protein [Pirellulaceae bacterium]|nr:DUF420 domain-containing protein [Pirellulaceae bacterium]MDP7014971.1 DUF420 domain-containing protein [Pirellulaceae bacterium]